MKIVATSFFLFMGVAGICALQKHFITHTNGKTVSPVIISPHSNETMQATLGHSFDFDVLDDDMLEEDNDDACTSVKKKFFSEKNSFINISFIKDIAPHNTCNKIQPSVNFYSSSHNFISLNVFRL